MKRLSILLFLAVFLCGCASTITGLTEDQIETDAALVEYADAVARGWAMRSGIIRGALDENNAPKWVYEKLDMVDAYLADKDVENLTDQQKGEMIGLMVRMSGPLFRAAIQQYAPGILNLGDVLPVLAFLGL